MSLQDLTQGINTLLETPTFEGHDEEQQKAALEACEKLEARLESPFHKTLRLLFSAVALRLAVDMKVFDAAAAAASAANESRDQPSGQIQLSELAKRTGVDELLLHRVMRMLVGLGFFAEPSEKTFAPLPIAASFTSESPLSAITIHVSHFYTILAQLPEYFAEVGWKNPDNVYNGPFQYAMRTDQHYFDFLSSKPYYQQAFNKVMTLSQRRRGKNWYSFFPVEEKLQVKDAADVVLVDVGGSQGGDITAFHEAFPNLPGRLVLQDLPVVVNECKPLAPKIEVLGHDFFQEQPIKGARAYFLRTVLHDWPDAQALQILQRVQEAMTPESLLLINETILPEHGVALSSAQADFTMMVSFASLERTQKQFEQLLRKAGFELVRVWMPAGFEGSAAELAEQSTLIEARLITQSL